MKSKVDVVDGGESVSPSLSALLKSSTTFIQTPSSSSAILADSLKGYQTWRTSQTLQMMKKMACHHLNHSQTPLMMKTIYIYGDYRVPETSRESANPEEGYDSMPELMKIIQII